ncbi:hypothetical protein CHLRE_15g641000v5 [Chlamydomonas reinhardtii]|uniref:RanBD1 domain-containing protein n=1 Tax=Chlamydomonas reinhardtii TaxID=3055 RepID=A0A2K3CWV4_CHLRE|nr:uncharacterized protein CHLRE_15g641000v5 [Chlamydomonas reinhardtii]PNW72749.1 hypothetical protein CHLRE_15g641000v5 [Chlamydomonas reinhardtii]
MSDERPSDALQPAAKKRAGGGQGSRDDPEEDDAPCVDPGSWTADATASRERRKVHVRRGAGGGSGAPAPAGANPFAGIALAGAAPAAAANPFAGVALSGGAPAAAAAEPKPAEEAGEAKAPAEAEAAKEEAKEEAKAAAAEGDKAAAAEGDKKAEAGAEKDGGKKEEAKASPSGAATAPGTATSIFGGAAGASSGFASLAAGGGGAATGFSFGGFGGAGGAAAGTSGGFNFGSGTAAAGTGTSGGFSFGAGTGTGLFGVGSGTGSGAFGGGSFSFPKLDTAGGEGAEGGGAEDKPDAFVPSEDPGIKPVVQLAVVQKVTGEETEQTIYAEAGKLFEYDSAAGKWRERGAGELRVNVGADGKTSRMLMRQSGNLRLLLNARIVTNMAVQRMNGANGVSFGCVNTAAPVDPKEEPKKEEAGKEGEDAKHGGGAVRTWAFRTKGEDKVLALLAALEKAKTSHATAHEEKKDAADAV